MKAVSLDVAPSWGIDWTGPAGAADEANNLLARIAPKSDTIHWLHCYYEPGERWQPVERLIIAEMIPRGILAGEDAFYRMMGEDSPDSLFAELEGPDPRTQGHYDKVLGRWVYDGLPPNITRRQWQLWRSHKAYGRGFWIVQGKHGGHKRSFSELERKILRFNGRPDQAPWAGQLPFARFDVRILEKLQAMDKLQSWMEINSSDWRNRTTKDVDQAKDAAKQAIEGKILDWLDSQLEDAVA